MVCRAGDATECHICCEAHVVRDCPVRGKCRRWLREGHITRDCTNPPNVWGTTPSGAASDAISGESGAGVSASEEAPASFSAPIGSWGSQVDLRDSERNSASEGLRNGPVVSTPQLFSSSGEPSGSDAVVPSSSGDNVGHGAAGPAFSRGVNAINVSDTVSRSESRGVTGAIDYNASGHSRNGNDTASSDTVSVTGVEKDPVGSSTNNGINNSVSNNSDNNVCVTVVDSGFVPPSGVSDVTSGTENVVSNVGHDVGAGNAVGGEAVAAGGDPRPQLVLHLCCLLLLVLRPRWLTLRRLAKGAARPPVSSDGDSSGAALSLKKGTKKGVRTSGAAGS